MSKKDVEGIWVDKGRAA